MNLGVAQDQHTGLGLAGHLPGVFVEFHKRREFLERFIK
jgi:hypothetical protein